MYIHVLMKSPVCNRPLAHHGNAANLGIEIYKKSYCSVLQIGCIPTDVQGVYTLSVRVILVYSWTLGP